MKQEIDDYQWIDTDRTSILSVEQRIRIIEAIEKSLTAQLTRFMNI